MAIAHLSAKNISRKSGRSPVAAAAYRSGERLYNEREGLTHDFTQKEGVVYSEIITPEKAPEWAKDRQKLWNEADRAEDNSTRRSTARTAKEIEVALPKELNRQQQIELVKDFTKENITKRGLVADINIHDKRDGNPHAHILVTTRKVGQDGFDKKKDRDLNNTASKELLVSWRKDWGNRTNQALEKAGRESRIDMRSYKDQGIDKIPTVHEGPKVRKMEKQGIKTERGTFNRIAEQFNKRLEKIKQDIKGLWNERRALKNERLKSQNIERRGSPFTPGPQRGSPFTKSPAFERASPFRNDKDRGRER